MLNFFDNVLNINTIMSKLNFSKSIIYFVHIPICILSILFIVNVTAYKITLSISHTDNIKNFYLILKCISIVIFLAVTILLFLFNEKNKLNKNVKYSVYNKSEFNSKHERSEIGLGYSIEKSKIRNDIAEGIAEIACILLKEHFNDVKYTHKYIKIFLENEFRIPDKYEKILKENDINYYFLISSIEKKTPSLLPPEMRQGRGAPRKN